MSGLEPRLAGALAPRLVVLLALSCSTVASRSEIPLAERRSGYDTMSPATRAMQDDEATGPAALWLLEGEERWNRPAGSAGKSCADCHGDARQSMRGVAARYPAFDAARGQPATLEQRIIECRARRQQASTPAYESRELLVLAAWVARQSKGMPIAPDPDPRSTPFRDAGRASFELRQGQLNLSCALCHDQYWGRSLGGTPIPQGHATGYPIYRLEWQSLGSLSRRLRSCTTGMRAQPYPAGSREAVDLELFLMWRARGMPLESPAVRP